MHTIFIKKQMSDVLLADIVIMLRQVSYISRLVKFHVNDRSTNRSFVCDAYKSSSL